MTDRKSGGYTAIVKGFFAGHEYVSVGHPVGQLLAPGRFGEINAGYSFCESELFSEQNSDDVSVGASAWNRRRCALT